MEKTQFDEMSKALETLNSQSAILGLPKIAMVKPEECKSQAKNARYFDPEMFQQLVDNVKGDKRLESIPLVYYDEDVIRIISGHHRVEAAKQAGLEYIYVFVIEPKDKDEIISKQLSHNALVGKDDKMILKELFNEIDSIEKKLATGLKSEIESLSYTSLNFRVGTFKALTLLFIEPDFEKVDQLMDEIKENGERIAGESVDLIHKDYFDKFATKLREIKKVENIKNNATAFKRMLEMVETYMKENEYGEEKQV